MNSKRKNCAITGRSSRARGPDRNVAAEGVYNNSLFMHYITVHIGNTVMMTTKNGQIYEGIFRTFSSQFEIVIEMAHKVDESRPNSVDPRTVVKKLFFKHQDILSILLKNVDLEFAKKDTFQTDTSISKFNGKIGERELEPWDGPGCNGDEFDLDGTTSNGWDVNDMFRKNEQVYGVKSSFDHSMHGYTTPLQKCSTKDFKDVEAKATKIASEIENNPTYKARLELENGNEEERFAAVARPASNVNGSSDKYVLTAKRKNNQALKTTVRNIPQVTTATSIQKPVYSVAMTNNSTQYHHSPNAYTQATVASTMPSGGQLPPQAAPVQSSTSSLTSAGTSNPVQKREPLTVQRERTNGQVNSAPPPKPQRTTGIRSGRSYNVSKISSIPSSRYEVCTMQQTPPARPGPTVTTDSKVPSAQSAPPHHVPNLAPPVHQPTSALSAVGNQRILTRPMRGREEQLMELKKFSSDFKLSKSAEEQSKPTNVLPAPTGVESEPIAVAKKQIVTPDVNKIASTLKKSNLNPNAKEFFYNSSAKPFVARSPSSPTHSRPHTPQMPSYGPRLAAPLPAMVMPAYVVTTAQPAYNATPNQANRYRKVPMRMPHRPDIASQMQVAAATGQPLLAPAPMPQFTMPYLPQGHITPQPYQQMVRMVAQQSSGMVSTSINYHHNWQTPQAPQMQYIGPHPHHTHHLAHPPPNTVPPHGQAGRQLLQGPPGHFAASGGYHHTPQWPANNYPQPPPPPPQGPHPPNAPPTHTFPMLCPILPSAPINL